MGKGQPPEERDKTLEDGGTGTDLYSAAPDELHEVAEDEGKGKGKQKEHQMLPLVEILKQARVRRPGSRGPRRGGRPSWPARSRLPPPTIFEMVKAMKAPIM